ncbi:MAG: response regulator [Treponema sp.]|jgi:chemotaxis protein histidine kinase CheA/ActR/RegA family two-component response regulator|nr:response regulator [Treponema sp.]
MALDKSKYALTFAEEGLENVSRAEALLFEIKDACEEEAREGLAVLLRALHTLKGSARMLEYRNVERLSHETESVFISVKEKKIRLNDDAVRLVLASFDWLKAGISHIKEGAKDGEDASALINELSALSAGGEFATLESAGESAPPPPPQEIENAHLGGGIDSAPEEEVFQEEKPGETATPTEAGESEDAPLQIDKSKYLLQFTEEAYENASAIEKLFLEIKNGAPIADSPPSLARSLRMIKSSARMLEFAKIEALAGALETAFLSAREERVSINDKAAKLILFSINALKKGIESAQARGEDGALLETYQKELLAFSAGEEYDIPGVDDGQKKAKKKQKEARESAAGKAESGKGKPEEARYESIRVSLGKIDEIIHNMAALQSLEIAARNIARDAEAINVSSRKFARLLNAEKSWNSPLLQEFRAVELMAGKLSSLVKNYSADVGNSITSAYEGIISLRMLPLSTALDAFPRHVWTMAQELGKKARIHIEGAENEIDKNLIESLSEVFLHMIRNSLDHGIEKPAERALAGKSETGLITARCVRESGNMKITISDDGRGIDTESIRRKIVKDGLAAKEAAAAMTEEELINFIFQSGFSTAEKITNVSGRGVGMDAVRNNIERMKGSVSVRNKPGRGTVFTVQVPLSMAALMGFPVTAGGMKFIIPANFVDTVLLINEKDIITVIDRPGVKYGDRIIKLFYLRHVLKIGEENKKDSGGPVFVVIVRAYEETLAIAADNVSSMRQVILKPMPSFLEHIEMFSGVVLNEDYEMVPALHIPTIIRMARRIKTLDMKKRHVDYERLRKSVLVVDDSGPTRGILRDIFETEGYKVDTAQDGAEALSAAKSAHYDLICTDLVMPNMDGFMLTENIRKNESLKDIPIIIISSKADGKDQNKAAMLGANRYILKNSFNSHKLAAAARELTGEADG